MGEEILCEYFKTYFGKLTRNAADEDVKSPIFDASSSIFETSAQELKYIFRSLFVLSSGKHWKRAQACKH